MTHLSNEFLAVIETPADGTRPASTGAWGAAYSLGASSVMGSYAQLVDGSTAWPSGCSDGMLLDLMFINTAVASTGHSALVTIGIDRAGGTSYTDWISNLLVSGAPQMLGGAYRYRFPIRVPRGASLGVKGQANSASPIATSHAACRIFCNPTRPELVRCGTFVQTFGVDTANSVGTAITIGNASEGSYVEIGTLDKALWHWEYGLGSTSNSWTASEYYTDIAIGDASNKRRVIGNARGITGTGETFDKMWAASAGRAAIGEKVYGRCQAGDNNAFTSATIAAYGVGG